MTLFAFGVIAAIMVNYHFAPNTQHSLEAAPSALHSAARGAGALLQPIWLMRRAIFTTSKQAQTDWLSLLPQRLPQNKKTYGPGNAWSCLALFKRTEVEAGHRCLSTLIKALTIMNERQLV